MNNSEIYKSSIIDDLLGSTTSEESEKIEKRMLLAAKIDDAIKAKGWKNKDLLKALNKDNPSVVTKWLSGTHNFTIDTLFDLERVLEVNLVNLEEKPKRTIAVSYLHMEVTRTVPVMEPIFQETILGICKSGDVSIRLKQKVTPLGQEPIKSTEFWSCISSGWLDHSKTEQKRFSKNIESQLVPLA